MTKDFRGYGGDASQVDNFDWYSPVQQDLALYSPPNPSGGGYDGVYGGGYGLPLYDPSLELYRPDPVFVNPYLYIPDYQYGGDSMGGLNDALNAQIKADIERTIAAQIQAQLLADEEFMKAAAALREAERKRMDAEKAEAERKRVEAAEAEKKRLAAAEAEKQRLAGIAAAAEAEKQRLAGIAAAAEAEKQRLAGIEAENKRQAALAEAAAAKAKAEALAAAEAERIAKEKAALAAKADASAKAIADAAVAAAEAERKRLAAIEAQKVADAAKIKSDVIVGATTQPEQTKKQIEIIAPMVVAKVPKTDTKPNNTLLIGGVLLALVGVYIITKD